MKRKQQLALLLLFVGLAGTYTAQAQPGKPGSAKLPGLRPPQTSGLVALTTLSGTVQEFTANEESVLDGFILDTGTKTVVVKFPPRLGQALQTAGKSGNKVTVTGSSDIIPEGGTVFRLVSLTNGQTVVTNSPPAVSAVPSTPTPITVKGKVVDYQLGRQGQVTGLRLSDQSLVRVPPHAAAQLTTIAPKESTISVDGFAHPVSEGEVRLKKQTIVDAAQLTVNGQSFLVR